MPVVESSLVDVLGERWPRVQMIQQEQEGTPTESLMRIIHQELVVTTERRTLESLYNAQAPQSWPCNKTTDMVLLHRVREMMDSLMQRRRPSGDG